MKSCRHDLPKFCSSIMSPESKDYNPNGDRDFLEGKVISCLKDSFAQGKPLTKKCQCKSYDNRKFWLSMRVKVW